MSLCRH